MSSDAIKGSLITILIIGVLIFIYHFVNFVSRADYNHVYPDRCRVEYKTSDDSVSNIVSIQNKISKFLNDNGFTRITENDSEYNFIKIEGVKPKCEKE